MENNQVFDEFEIDLREIIKVLWAKIWLIIALGVICGAAMFAYTKYTVAPVYSSTTKVYILNQKNTNTEINYTALQTSAQLTKDYMELVKNRTILTEVVEELNLDLSVDQLAGMISLSSPDDTRVVAISVKSTDPAQAQKIADAVRELSTKHIVELMKIDAVNTVETANMPTAPMGPNVGRNTMFGCFAGVFLGMVIAVGIYLTHRCKGVK